MSYILGDKETICALSTPEGQGGIAVIRVSGSQALSITQKLCPALPKTAESHRAYFAKFISLKSQQIIDEVLVTYFEDGRSFTGEETIEISCHGSQYLVLAITSELVGAGCRVADRGEFTFRAFMNGRLDLAQAEGILGLIKSHNKAAAGVALNQMRGSLSKTYREIENKIVLVLSHLEASIDFTHEDIDPMENKSLNNELKTIEAACEKLLMSYTQGRILSEGCRVAIVGAPNVGKSSLLNQMVQEEKSIVTPLPGTTRDLIEGCFVGDGFKIQLVDSAGIRESEDAIERLGVKKALESLSESTHVLIVLDGTEDLQRQMELFRGRLDGKITAVVVNKIDLIGKDNLMEYKVSQINQNWIFVSALTGEGLALVGDVLAKWSREVSDFSSAIITQSRHFELLGKTKKGVAKAHELLNDCTSPEIIVFELQEAVRGIHEILGKEYSDQVLDRVFKEFCIGK
ncbi:MAG: tRNA uridine-5-carboxymethylaminomethyl(34) synthesis GTPase MnmE [Pseudomonadota bacterium]|nr:tRNA uridine-5-carboxymethylaminomethyl(34) synthesis GTPase MnmE [Pseudomonadota bacterium]